VSCHIATMECLGEGKTQEGIDREARITSDLAVRTLEWNKATKSATATHASWWPGNGKVASNRR
jgi:hypothetical protein